MVSSGWQTATAPRVAARIYKKAGERTRSTRHTQSALEALGQWKQKGSRGRPAWGRADRSSEASASASAAAALVWLVDESAIRIRESERHAACATKRARAMCEALAKLRLRQDRHRARCRRKPRARTARRRGGHHPKSIAIRKGIVAGRCESRRITERFSAHHCQ